MNDAPHPRPLSIYLIAAEESGDALGAALAGALVARTGGAVKFAGEVTPDIKLVTYKINMKRVINRRLVVGIGDGVMEADGKPIYEAEDLRVGLYQRP